MTVGQIRRDRYLWNEDGGTNRRKQWCGKGTTESLVNIGKWSDGVQRVVRDGAREESETESICIQFRKLRTTI